MFGRSTNLGNHTTLSTIRDCKIRVILKIIEIVAALDRSAIFKFSNLGLLVNHEFCAKQNNREDGREETHLTCLHTRPFFLPYCQVSKSLTGSCTLTARLQNSRVFFSKIALFKAGAKLRRESQNRSALARELHTPARCLSPVPLYVFTLAPDLSFDEWSHF